MIGPNAVIQLAESLRAAGLERVISQAFSSAGAGAWLAAPPVAMVDAAQVGRLHRAVRATLPPAQAAAVMADAGRRTADYLLSARIPRPVRLLLKLLPARLSARLLVSAIRAHAWTFAGAGRFWRSPDRLRYSSCLETRCAPGSSHPPGLRLARRGVSPPLPVAGFARRHCRRDIVRGMWRSKLPLCAGMAINGRPAARPRAPVTDSELRLGR